MTSALRFALGALLATTGHAAAQSAPAPTAPTTTASAAGAAEPPARPDGEPGAVEPAPLPPPAPAFDAAALEVLVDARVDARLAQQKKTAGWKDGFFLQTEDAQTKLKIGGFTQFDGRFFVADTDDPHIDQFGFRSIRPDLQGTLFGKFDFRLLPDFAGGRLVLQDAYGDIRFSEAVKLRFGKFKVGFGLERLQSETTTTFVERGLPTLITPNRDLGVQIHGELAKGAVSYQVGVFNGVADGQSGDADVSDDKEVAARIFVKPLATVSPALKELGIGAAVTYGDKTGTVASPDVAGYRTQGQTAFFAYKTGTTLMDTVVADGEHWRVTGQGYYYRGPLGLLGEVVRSRQKVVLAGTHQRVTTDAWQLVGQWVLTGGESSFKGVTPVKAFDPSKGHWGAFDLAARIGEIQLAGADVFPRGYADPTRSAKKAWSAGAGADWYPNKNFRVILDFEHTWYDGGAREGDKEAESSLVGRFQTIF